MNTKKLLAIVLCLLMTAVLFAGCGSAKDSVLIYTSAEDYIIESMQEKLAEKFPDTNVIVEYVSTGDMAARLVSEGKNSDCDIVYSLEYPYIKKLAESDTLANISEIVDTSIFTQDAEATDYYIPVCRTGGAIVVNTDVLKQKKLPEPSSYQDLLDPKYKDLISMPNPKSSGTGYMFMLALMNSMGEEEAFDYFDKLSNNIFQFTSSGSGPINALLQGEAAIGLGMTGQAVVKINSENAPFKILYFDEGSPYSFYGLGLVAGKEQKEGVSEIFNFLATDYVEYSCQEYYPEKIFADKDFSIENHPTDVKYADMSDNTPERKERLLEKWTH